VNWWRRLSAWWSQTWQTIRPGPEARKGAAWGAVALAATIALIAALNLNSGFGLWFDFLFCFAFAAIAVPLVGIVVAGLLTVFRKLPRFISGVILAASALTALMLPPPAGLILGAAAGLAECLLGAAIATFLAGSFGRAAPAKKIIVIGLCAFAVAVNVALVFLFASDGTLNDIVKLSQPASPPPSLLQAQNPAELGTYRTKALFYGVGNDIRRPEYGPSVAIKTRTVDASTMLADFKGWKKKLRRFYWGFDVDKLPLNGRVWYPDGAGPFPLVLIVHDNHEMTKFSDPGYQYLGELLASRGFILASIDENFLNSGLFHDPPKQQTVRGWMLLEHLKLWREWNQAPGNPFYRKVDFDNIALMGHSRGGEAAATAAFFNNLIHYPDDATMRFDYNYPIKAVMAIAPVEGQYKPAGQGRIIENVSYLVIQGANDADVASFMGSQQWERVKFNGDGPWFKAELYIYRANHGQFNTVWGRTDAGAPYSWMLNLKPLMSGEDQRRIAKTYIAGFLEATLHNRREYLPLFRDYRAIRSWLPDTYYASRYQDAGYKVVANFNEDADVNTTTLAGGQIESEGLSVWREGRIPVRDGKRDYNGVFIGWNRTGEKAGAPAPAWWITLPEGGLVLGPQHSVLNLSIATSDEEAPLPGKKDEEKKPEEKKKEPSRIDFTVELEARDGRVMSQPLSKFGGVLPPLNVLFTKLGPFEDWFYAKPAEPVFQTIAMPLTAFGVSAPLKRIRLRFDRDVKGVVIISQIGFSVAGP
jgi:dienelactone hydrolase